MCVEPSPLSMGAGSGPEYFEGYLALRIKIPSEAELLLSYMYLYKELENIPKNLHFSILQILITKGTITSML